MKKLPRYLLRINILGLLLHTLPLAAEQPLGFASAVSRTDRGIYHFTDAGSGSQCVLLSNGQDMSDSIRSAMEQYDCVCLDGAAGAFMVSESICLKGLKNKTLTGVNNATICTEFYISDSIRHMLDAAGVNQMSTDGGGGRLPNGAIVREQREYAIRKLLCDLYHDSLESYRQSGILSIQDCENIAIRNLRLVGPGAIDIGGSDLISCIRTTHLWVDHCELQDGMDGNFDITQRSDFVSVTWCHFHYTERSYDHCYSNLICASDRQSADSCHLNVTFAYCLWGKGCEQRMPMVRYGKIHVLNCYFHCPESMRCINARKESEVLVEGCYAADGVRHFFVDGGSRAYCLRRNHANIGHQPKQKGKVSVPYSYHIISPARVPDLLLSSHGAGVQKDGCGTGKTKLYHKNR